MGLSRSSTCVVLFVGLLGSSRSAGAGSPPGAAEQRRALGAAMGDGGTVLLAAARARGGTCVAPSAAAILCRTPAVAPLGPGQVGYWLEAGQLARLVFVGPPDAASYAALERQFGDLAARIEGAFGAPASPPNPTPPWFAASNDGARLAAVVSGRYARFAVWSGEIELTLELRAVAGAPRVVLTATDRRRPACTKEEIGDRIIDLFPPATDAARGAAIEQLGVCGESRAVGAVVAALEREADAEIRARAVVALGGLGGTAAAQAVARAARFDPDADVRRRAVGQLGRLGATDAARAVADDGGAPAAVRDEAMWQLAMSGAWPERGELGRLVASEPAAASLSRWLLEVDAAATAEKVAAVTPTLDPYASGSGSGSGSESGSTSGSGSGSDAGAGRRSGPADGTGLAVTTTTIASTALFPTLAAMAELDDVGSLLLTGTAGAVIGTGTALGIFRFSRTRPTLAQSAWYSNVVGWGALAGLHAFAATEGESAKVRFGLLAAGQVAGLGLGAWSAARHEFSLGETVLADSFVLGAGLSAVGVDLLRDREFGASRWAAFATAPVMVGSAVLAHALSPTANDVALIGYGTPALGWTGALLAAGALERPLASKAGVGGAAVGLGAGYLATTLATPFVETSPARVRIAAGGLMAGDAFGLGLHMLLAPDDRARWPLGAALGGLGYGAAAYLVVPHVRPGPAAAPMAVAGAAYGGGAWMLAALAGSTGEGEPAQLFGGALSGGVLGATAGLVASPWFRPTPVDQARAAAGTVAGMSAGLGVARLATDDRGRADTVGVMAGAAAGLALGAVAAHRTEPRGADAGGYALGGAALGFAGLLIPTLPDATWDDGRDTQGGALLGAGLGALGGAAASRALDASPGQIGAAAIAAGLGTTLGLGVGMLSLDQSSRPERIGALVGQVGLLSSAVVAEPWLHLGDGLGPSAGLMGLTGGVLGTAYGALAAHLVSGAATTDHQRGGGALAGASGGLAGALVLSRWFAPTPQDHLVAIGGSALGHSLGLGVAQLGWSDAATPRGEAALRLAGGLGGLLGGAVAAHHLDVTPADLGAAALGAGYGAAIGALVPSLGEEDWKGDRRDAGGANVGLAIGGATSAAVAHATGATGDDVKVPAKAGALGAGIGGGVGMLATERGGQAPRIGFVAGTLALGVGAGFAAAPLHLAVDEPSRPRLRFAGGVLGGTYGLLLAETIDPFASGQRDDRYTVGGLLAGASGGVAAGVAAARWLHPTNTDVVVAYGGATLGAGLGLGAARLAFDDHGAADPGLALGGSLVGLGAAAVGQRVHPMTARDGGALTLGLGVGGLIGGLAPTLDEPTYRGLERDTEGGLLFGGAAGGFGAIAAARLAGADGRAVGLAALGAGHGLVTGLGVGALLEDDGESQVRRVGVAAGTGAGALLGALWLPRVHLSPDDRWLIGGATAVGGWTGALLPALGHADRADVAGGKVPGGVMAGAGLGSLAAAVAASRADVDPRRVRRALALDAIFTGAGLGVGALVSERDDAPAWGALGGGTAGLALGGALADHIAFDEARAPLHAAAALEGAWFGAWLPYVLEAAPSDRQIVGGTAAGGLGALGLAALAGDALRPSTATVVKVGLGGALGTSIAGGAALVAEDLTRQERAGLMLGGTTVGGALGLWLAPRFSFGERATRMAAVGGLLGVSEGLTFAWAGHADRDAAYGGAALVGGGVGTMLGFAAASSAELTAQRALIASGFAGWGGWIGSFSGALVDAEPRTIVVGGLIGTNLGLATGLGVSRTALVRPQDFGWLSLAGAVGTVGGAGVGALFSSKENRAPILAGLAIGPVAGMATGALMLPVLRRLGGPPAAAPTARRSRRPAGEGGAVARSVRNLFDVAEWQPMFGALPSLGLAPGAPPIGGGVTGTLH